jgi:ERCC4 domain
MGSGPVLHPHRIAIPAVPSLVNRPTRRPTVFAVAANPDPNSSLPFLIRLPLPDGELVLKARDSWPRTAKVYCHRAEEWPDEPEIVERVAVRSCRRRGVAIDLVLDRPRENRSQLVFTRIQGGREAIFWQSARTTRQARPGIRVPRRRAGGLAELTILVDTRERYPYRFAHQQATTQREALPVGDYGIADHDQLVAVVERKSLADLTRRLIDGQLSYALAEMATLPRAAVVVEDRYSSLFKLEHTKPGFVAELLAALTVRYPTVPIAFCETRPLAEEWTYRFLGAALAYAQSETDER